MKTNIDLSQSDILRYIVNIANIKMLCFKCHRVQKDLNKIYTISCLMGI